MKQRQYLITGATGKTGVHTVRNLLKDGHAVRAFVIRKTSGVQRCARKAPKSWLAIFSSMTMSSVQWPV